MTSNFARIMEVLEILVISAHTNWVRGAKEEWLSAFEAEYYSSQFFVMRIVVCFCWQETSRVKGYRVDPILKFLGNNYTQGIAQGVCIH